MRKIETGEIDRLLRLQGNHSRWFTKEEFNRLAYLSKELFKDAGNPMDSEVEKISGDGVFFRCSNCDYEPKMGSNTDDLVSMNYCPSCGSKFKPGKMVTHNSLKEEIADRLLSELGAELHRISKEELVKMMG